MISYYCPFCGNLNHTDNILSDETLFVVCVRCRTPFWIQKNGNTLSVGLKTAKGFFELDPMESIAVRSAISNSKMEKARVIALKRGVEPTSKNLERIIAEENAQE